MPAVPITGSDNITSLDSRIYADFCTGNFLVDVSPSVFLAGGTSTSGGVQGASVRITNPVGVIIKNYSTSGFDIYPPMTSVVTVAIPLIASNYQYGTYTIDVRLTDENGTEYTVTKTVNICPPDPNNKTKKTGCLNATIAGNCKDGKVVVSLNQPPTYKGTISTSQINDLELEFPTASRLPVFETTFGSFSKPLFEGQYLLTGTTCVLYSYGDSVYFKVQYKIKCSKVIKCIIDECCVFAKLEELNLKLKTDCTAAEKAETSLISLDAIRLLKMAQLAAECGQDPSDIVADLEDLLGCQCTCNCNDGTPIINNAPVTDYVIEGCNVEENTVGLTKTYTINNYGYKVELAEGSDAGLTLSAPVLNIDNCEYVQTLDYTAPSPVTPVPQSYIYRALLTQSGTGNPTAIADASNTVTIAWTRVSAGVYSGVITTIDGVSILNPNNTFILISPTLINSDIAGLYNSSTTIRVLTSVVDAGIATDGLLSKTPIQLSILS